MIAGIGIDIVHVNRLRRWLERPALLERYFHPEELFVIQEKGASAVLSLAARFAAKEAFGKALGTGLRGISLKNIRVINDRNGKPDMKLEGNALAACERMNIGRIHVTLTHESDNAVAFVLLEK